MITSLIVFACIAQAAPPLGAYTLSAQDLSGKLAYTGILKFEKKSPAGEAIGYTGRRSLVAKLPEKNVNPISGTGTLEMTYDDGQADFNMHVGWRDNNTTFSGKWDGKKFKGEWGSVTFVGYKKRGAFELVRASRPYADRAEKLGQGDKVRLSVYDMKTNRTVWQRTFDTPARPSWSPDGKVLAVVEDQHIGFWHSGRYSRYPLSGRGEGVYPESIVWSPDSKHILMRIPGSMGEWTFETGGLSVTRAKDGHGWVVRKQVSRAEWKNTRSVEYHTKTFGEGDPVENGPFTWRLP